MLSRYIVWKKNGCDPLSGPRVLGRGLASGIYHQDKGIYLNSSW